MSPTTTTTQTGGLFSGINDFFGGIINSDLGQAALDIYKQKTAADIAEDQAKAIAKIEADRARAAAAAARADTATGGAFGMSSQTLLLAGAGIVAAGLIIYAATRRA